VAFVRKQIAGAAEAQTRVHQVDEMLQRRPHSFKPKLQLALNLYFCMFSKRIAQKLKIGGCVFNFGVINL
jgi:hypothetical protein